MGPLSGNTVSAAIRESGAGAGSDTGGRTRTAFQSPIGTQPTQRCCDMGALCSGPGIGCPAIAIGCMPSCAAAGMAGAPKASMTKRIRRNSTVAFYRASIQIAIATIIKFSVSDTKPSGTLLDPPTQAHLSARLSI